MPTIKLWFSVNYGCACNIVLVALDYYVAQFGAAIHKEPHYFHRCNPSCAFDRNTILHLFAWATHNVCTRILVNIGWIHRNPSRRTTCAKLNYE